MSKALILGLMVLCSVHGPNAREAKFAEELKSNGIKLEAGPWDINDEQSLIGMLGYRAIWMRYVDGTWLWAQGKDVKHLFIYDQSKEFNFNTTAEIQDLAQKLRNGKVMSETYLLFYKDYNQVWEFGNNNISILYFDPHGFFFSVNQTFQSPPALSWNTNKASYEVAAKPEVEQTKEELRLEDERKKQAELLNTVKAELLEKISEETARRDAEAINMFKKMEEILKENRELRSMIQSTTQ